MRLRVVKVDCAATTNRQDYGRLDGCVGRHDGVSVLGGMGRLCGWVSLISGGVRCTGLLEVVDKLSGGSVLGGVARLD